MKDKDRLPGQEHHTNKTIIIFYILLFVLGTVGIGTYVIRSGGPRYPIFWVVSLIHICLAFLTFKIPKSPRYLRAIPLIVVPWATMIIALSVRSLKPIGWTWAVYIFTTYAIGFYLRFIKDNPEAHITGDLKVLPSHGGKAESVEDIRTRADVKIHRDFDAPASEHNVRERIVDYMLKAGYSPKSNERTLVFWRGSKIGSQFALSPRMCESIAEIRVTPELTGASVSADFHVHTLLRFPWEKQYWISELRDLESALQSDSFMPSKSIKASGNVLVLNTLASLVIILGILPVSLASSVGLGMGIARVLDLSPLTGAIITIGLLFLWLLIGLWAAFIWPNKRTKKPSEW